MEKPRFLKTCMGLYYYRLLIWKVGRMYEKEFDFKNFRRTLRPFCKVSGNDENFTIKIKLSDYQAAVTVAFVREFESRQIRVGNILTSVIYGPCFVVRKPNDCDDTALFIHTNCSKHLLKKIIKHNFLNYIR